MSAATSLQALVERYLVERRRLGFALRSPAYALRGFARHVQAVGHRGPLTVELMVDWARSDSHGLLSAGGGEQIGAISGPLHGGIERLGGDTEQG